MAGESGGGYESYAGYGSREWRNRIALEMLRRQQQPITSVGGGILSASKNFLDYQTMDELIQREKAREAGLTQGSRDELGGRTARLATPPGAPQATTARPPGTGAAPAPPNFFENVPTEGNFGKLPKPDYSFSFNEASLERPAAMPTAQSADERVPLPPPRPVYDRNVQNAELEANPALKQRLLTIAKGEGFDPRTVMETVFNRAKARDTSLARETEQYGGRGTRGYYPSSTFGRGQVDEDLLTDVMRGSDVGGAALGFAPTGNASGGVAARGIESGRYGNVGRMGGETLVTQESPEQLARLDASRVPEAPLDITPEQPSAAVPFTQGRDAITSAMVPPPTAPIRLATAGGAPTPDTAPAATPAVAPYRNPINIRTDITPMPQRMADAGLGRIPPEPVPPVKNETLTPGELYGWDVIAKHPGDAAWKEIAMRSITPGEQQREAEYQRKVKKYDADLAVYNEYLKELYPHKVEERRLKRETDEQTLLENRRAYREKLPAGPATTIEDPNIGGPQSRQKTGPRVPPTPEGIAEGAWRADQEKLISKDIEAYDKALPKFNSALRVLNEIRAHPGFNTGVGALGVIARNTPQTAAFGFDTRVNEAKGKVFLSGYDDLRGMGNPSTVESTKAEQARARLDPRQNKADFIDSLNEYENTLRTDLETVQRKLNYPVTAWRKPGDNTSVAPDKDEIRRDFSDGVARQYLGGDPYDIKNNWRPVRQ